MRDVRVDVRERLAADPDHLVGAVEAAAEEPPVWQPEHLLRRDALHGLAGSEPLLDGVDLLRRLARQSRAHVPATQIAEHLRALVDPLLLRVRVRAVLEAEVHLRGRERLLLEAEHLEPANKPLVRGLLHRGHRHERIALGGALDPAAQRHDAGREVERLLAEHRRHALGVGPVGGDLLHRELVLPHPVDERREHDVVEKAVELEVERGEVVRPGLRREDVLDRIVGLLAAHGGPVLVRDEVDHLVAVAELLGHDPEHPRAILVVVGARERALVLLDGAELGRRLRLHGVEELLRRTLVHVGRLRGLGLALAVAVLDDVGGDLPDARAEAERRVLGEEAVPALDERGIVREVVLLPVDDGLVVLLRQLPRLLVHGAPPLTN